MRKALVTGGAGFIGSHLVDSLVSSGWSVTVIDDLSAGAVYNIPARDNLLFVPGTLLDRKVVDRVTWGVDAIFHLAARCDIRKSLADHFTDFDNVQGTLNLLESAHRNKVPDFILTSTCAVYGEAKTLPTSEEYLGTQESLYSASKFSCEAYAQAFTGLSKMKLWTFRFSNVVGSRCRRGVTWDFVMKLRDDPKRLEILGNGRQSKEYLHVSDCIAGIMTGYERSKGRVNTFNLATPVNTSVSKVADIVIKTLGLKSVDKKFTGGKRGWVGDLPTVRLSVKKMSALGWKPKVRPEDAVKENALWARSQA